MYRAEWFSHTQRGNLLKKPEAKGDLAIDVITNAT